MCVCRERERERSVSAVLCATEKEKTGYNRLSSEETEKELASYILALSLLLSFNITTKKFLY